MDCYGEHLQWEEPFQFLEFIPTQNGPTAVILDLCYNILYAIWTRQLAKSMKLENNQF